MQKVKLLKARVLVVAVLGMLSTMVATAGPIVTEWGFQVDSGFTSITGTGGSGSGPVGSNGNAYWGAPSTITWGSGTGPGLGNGRSGIDIGGASNGTASGTVTTNGGAVSTVTFTHTNNVISGGSNVLKIGMLSDRIILDPTPLSPSSGDEFSPPPLEFGIHFTETPNGGTCAAVSPTPCNDIFVLDIVNAGFNSLNNSINQMFAYDGNFYNARIFIDGIGLLTNNECSAAGALNGCVGLTTVESQTNTFQISLDISTELFEVPEPNILFMLVFGLLLLAYSQWYRKVRI